MTTEQVHYTDTSGVTPTKGLDPSIENAITRRFKEYSVWMVTVVLSAIFGFIFNAVWDLNAHICEYKGATNQILINTEYYQNKIKLLESENKNFEIENKNLKEQLELKKGKK